MDERMLERLKDLGRPRRVGKGQVLLTEGDPVEGFFWLVDGTVRVHQLSLEGRELELARFGPKEWLAPALALSATRFPHFVTAVTAARLLYFPRDEAIHRITHDAELSAHFLTLLATRCRFLHDRLTMFQLHTLRDRLEQYLVRECPHDGGCQLRLAMTKGELARSLGATPESLSRTLRQLEEEGVIEMHGRAIRILRCGRRCS